MRRSSWAAVAAAGLVAGALVGNGAGATASESDAALRFDVAFSPFNLVDVGAPGFSDGDEIVFHDTLLRGGRQVGDQVGSCVIADASQALANCTMVIRLARGDISASFANSPPPEKSLAITGGTRAYRTARGDGTLLENGDGTGTLTLRL